MKTENNVPLYKVLNENRTQGELEPCKDAKHSHVMGSYETGKIQPVLYIHLTSDKKTCKANAAYTALAVNNLHLLAEALNDLIKQATETTKDLCGFDGADVLDAAIDKAKEALNRIS